MNLILLSCSSSDDTLATQTYIIVSETTPEETINYAKIAFSNRILTLPVDENNKGSPNE